MKRSRFTEEQIIGILPEQEAGMTTAEVCRRRGISLNRPGIARGVDRGSVHDSPARRVRRRQRKTLS